jgi:hypothetical protein
MACLGEARGVARPDVRCGSKTEVAAPNFDFRFTPESGPNSDSRAITEKCQQRKSTPLFDHLVDDRKYARRNGQAEGLGGL